MDSYEKRGYLDREFRLFHLSACLPGDISYHYHDFDKVLIFLRGDVDYVIEGRSYHLNPYDIVLVGHHSIHKPLLRSGDVNERIVVYLSPGYVDSFRTENCDLSRCFKDAREHCSDVLRISSLKISSLYESLIRLEKACREDGYAKELYCRILFLEFMIHLNRAASGSHLEYVSTSPSSEKVLEIMRYISENPSADFTIDSLASRFFLSKFHMMRLFKQETGYTINSYINEKRLLMAKELLGRNLPVTEVCFRCGFRNYAAFLRAYKKNFGENPKSGKRPEGRTSVDNLHAPRTEHRLQKKPLSQ